MPTPGSCLPAAVLTLAGLAPAQIPVDVALVFETTALTAPYYRFVDVFGRGATQVREQNAFMPITSIATDPNDPAFFYWIGAASSLPGTWRAELTVLAAIDTSLWGPWSQTPALRVAVGSQRIVTLATSGDLEAWPRVAPTPGTPLLANVAGGNDVAAVLGLVYVSTAGSGNPTPLVEWNLTTNTQRTVGSYSDMRSIAVDPTGSELTIGTTNGDLVRVAVGSGAILDIVPTGLGPLTAVGYTRFRTRLWTDGVELWSELANLAPLYTSPTGIADFAVATATGASATPFGGGCGVGDTVQWTASGSPTLGNASFELGLANAPATTAALFLLGTSRTQWAANNSSLPFDLGPLGAPGCELLAAPQVSRFAAIGTNGSTDVAIPIPASATFAGLELAAQFFVADPSLPLGAATTEAVAIVIG